MIKNSKNVSNSTIDENPFSFKAGWNVVPQGQVPEIRSKIMEALGITHISNFYKRLNGEVIPKVSEAKAIEEIFASYGITEIWGE